MSGRHVGFERLETPDSLFPRKKQAGRRASFSRWVPKGRMRGYAAGRKVPILVEYPLSISIVTLIRHAPRATFSHREKGAHAGFVPLRTMRRSSRAAIESASPALQAPSRDIETRALPWC